MNKNQKVTKYLTVYRKALSLQYHLIQNPKGIENREIMIKTECPNIDLF